MNDAINRLKSGFQILARAQTAGARVPCFICSPAKPKFEKGWQVSLDDTGQMVLVGQDCALRHLGIDWSARVRAFENEEARQRRERRVSAILHLRSQIAAACETTLQDQGLLAIRAVCDAVLELSREARRYLDRCAIGEGSGVAGASIFGAKNPRGDAKDVLAALQTIADPDASDGKVNEALRTFEEGARRHNQLVKAYGDGRAFFTPKNIRAVSDSMPSLTFEVRQEELIIRQKIGSELRSRPLPQPLQLVEIPLPEYLSDGGNALS